MGITKIYRALSKRGIPSALLGGCRDNKVHLRNELGTRTRKTRNEKL